MLSLLIFFPLVAALGVLTAPRRAVVWLWVGASAGDLALVLAMWIAHGTKQGMSYETDVRRIPSVRSAYHLGADGLSLPLLTLTAGLFAACAIYSLRQQHRVREFAVLFLFLETVCLGLFAALDLLLFFVFFDLSIVGMYFVILLWGHSNRRRSALTFFLYTFLGSLILLLGFIGLYLGAEPHTFDMVELTRTPPLTGSPGLAGLTLLAVGIGLGIKTPVVPFHTWLPPAHTDAPAAGSAILAGVMLKMGPYVVLALGAAGYATGDRDARQLAVTGAVTQMVSHGLVTGALFLLCGVLYERARSYDLGRFGGVAGTAPVFAGLLAVAAFASLGLPGLSGFIAEFQIFAGTIGSGTVAAAVAGALAVLGILITAGLFLRVLHRVLLGPPGELTSQVTDVRRDETGAIAPLLVLSLVIGLTPRVLLDTIEPLSAAVIALVGR